MVKKSKESGKRESALWVWGGKKVGGSGSDWIFRSEGVWAGQANEEHMKMFGDLGNDHSDSASPG